MKVELEEQGEAVVVRPAGRLDAQSAPELSEALAPLLERPAPRIVLDFSGVPYVSSAGLRVVLQAAKQVMGRGSLAVCGLARPVQQVFDLAGFGRILSIHNDAAAALAALQPE